MYLTDYREYCLKDVIEQLEPELFRKVTGLTLKDFSLLVSLGVFNSELMNDAVYKFKRYEDSSLEYTGIDMHSSTLIGGWDTVIDTSKQVVNNLQEDLGTKPHNQVEIEPWKQLKAGDTVVHKTFGSGNIKSIDDKYIIVQFADRESRFLFPLSFEKGYFKSPRL